MPVKAARRLLAGVWDGKTSLSLPIDPRVMAKKEGVRVIADSALSADSISGEFNFENGVPVIRYNPHDSLKRQRFTIAHELGHFALNHGHAFRDNKKNFSLNNFDLQEVAANKFAAELLMPEIAVRILVNKRKITDIEELARLFDVSVIAIKYRLEKLGFL
ncbi:ImmA/IrrE family metallo-endopeptidase [Salmonella enterica]|nr:ImmA/IrrE family metallo-endopeptidase [Salmonella enterica subsp. enterica serovar Infantis]EGI5077054.1 ImmA/IrrE family metallo-endopeptidase [Salmonella enterica subsp. enterica serovar Infantis]EJZ7016824.1 ImmA/IrrE family metallo-endopeptidase [Salmonella enterica]